MTKSYIYFIIQNKKIIRVVINISLCAAPTIAHVAKTNLTETYHFNCVLLVSQKQAFCIISQIAIACINRDRKPHQRQTEETTRAHKSGKRKKNALAPRLLVVTDATANIAADESAFRTFPLIWGIATLSLSSSSILPSSRSQSSFQQRYPQQHRYVSSSAMRRP